MAQNGTLPQNTLREALHCFGYGDEHIETNWPLLDLEALKAGKNTASPLSLAIAAFNHERRRDWSTSAIVCDLSRPNVVGNAVSGREALSVFV